MAKLLISVPLEVFSCLGQQNTVQDLHLCGYAILILLCNAYCTKITTNIYMKYFIGKELKGDG